MTRFRVARTLLMLLAISCALAPRIGLAQEATDSEPAAPDPWAGVEEMLVVGSGVAAILQADTTSAISFDADFLRAEGVADISDISSLTPNLEIKTAFAASNPTLFIRGVGLDDFNANSASAVAVYQDGVYMNSPVGQLFQLFDTEKIDVLLGPQARRRNANAGAIMIYSKKPTNEFSAFTETTYGRFNEISLKAAVNVPIIPDVLSARTSMVINRRDGITKNLCNGFEGQPGDCFLVPQGTEGHVNNRDNWAARSLVRFTPSSYEDFEILLNVHGGVNDSQAAQFQHRGFKGQGASQDNALFPGPDQQNYQDLDSDPFSGQYNNTGKEKIDLAGGSIRVSWEPTDEVEVLSLTGTEWHKRNTISNDDASPRRWFDRFNYRDDAWQLSQELSLIWSYDDWASIELTGYFLMEDLDAENDFPNEAPGRFNIRTIQKFTQETRYVAGYVYGHADMPPIDGMPEYLEFFSLDATVRYSYEYKNFALDSEAIVVSGSGNRFDVPQQNKTLDDGFQGVSGDVSINYYFGRFWDNEDVSFYAKYSRGWKAGHFNGGTTFSTEPVEPVDPEIVDAFEIGFKTKWFDDRFRLDISGFHYLYDDQQIFQVSQDGQAIPLPKLINANESKIWGAEAEIDIEPIEGLQINFKAGWLDSEYSDLIVELEEGGGSIFRPPDKTVQNFSGNPLLASPEWSASGSIEYTLETRFGSITPRYSFSYRDDVFFDPNQGRGVRGQLPEATIGQEAYWLHNVGMTYATLDGQIEVTGWVRNFLDKEYRVQSFDFTQRTTRFVIDAYGDPMTYGVTVVLRFD